MAEQQARPPTTIEDLERWEEHGAIWRARELTDERAVVELCTCYGEPVDLVARARTRAHRVRAPPRTFVLSASVDHELGGASRTCVGARGGRDPGRRLH